MSKPTETVAILPDGGTDRFGDPLPAGPERLITGVLIIPRTSTENSDERQNTVVVGVTAIFPRGTDMSPADRVRTADGQLWEIVGEPGDYGRKVIAALERTMG